MHETAIFPLPLLNLTSTSCYSTRFPKIRENFGDSRTFKADLGLLIFACIFKTSWPKMAKSGNGWCDVDPNKLAFTFGGSYVYAIFGENRSRDATVRVPTDGYTH